METVFENMERANNDSPGEQVKEDLRTLVRDAEDLLKATARDGVEKAKEARSRLSGTLEKAKETCRRLEQSTVDTAKATARATDKVIREHPYETIGVAFGLGLLVGVLVMRR